MTSAASDATQLVEWLKGPIGSDAFKRVAELHSKTPHDRSKVALGIKRALPDQPSRGLNFVLDIFFARLAMSELGSWTQAGFFLDQTRQQATHPDLAAWHSARFAGCENILEIGTGCGLDTRALARSAKQIITLEADAILAEFARYNFSLQDISNVEVRHCALEELKYSNTDFDGIWADPARRTSDGTRIKDPKRYSPSLGSIVDLAEKIIPRVCGIKLSASLDRSLLPAGWGAEWLGLRDECRELVAWRYAGSPDQTPPDCASLVDHKVSWSATSATANLINLNELGSAFLLEPHGALIRTQALEGFAAAHDFQLWDRSIAYMIATSKPPSSPWYSRFRVIEIHKFGDKLLQQRLRALGWGNRTEFKKRGFPLTPDEVRARMRLEDSDKFGTVVLTRRDQDHYVFLCERLNA